MGKNAVFYIIILCFICQRFVRGYFPDMIKLSSWELWQNRCEGQIVGYKQLGKDGFNMAQVTQGLLLLNMPRNWGELLYFRTVLIHRQGKIMWTEGD
jgi:hypothetical protein